ncbi:MULTISPECIES: hypothetical protein [Burkholderiaceae]|uniref:hypothetical protein n=1 Tax=Burkholderiaceae TaxID=119060 RepID=UPI0009613AF9|nr:MULTISPECIES: hypothetical protein [Burkholderiaceae]MCG1040136.1 hypothetical protein [Mycetohabitans sp. B7]SIT64997.1 hypothetical protein SAMN04487769_0233 [Burkholderia sp. b14]
MDFDLNAALNDYQAYICALETRPQTAALAPPPPQPLGAAWANPSAKRPITYQDLPAEVIARIGDYVPIQDVMSFSTVDRCTYHAMQPRRLVHRYWQRAKQAVNHEAIKQLLNEMDGTLADPAQHAEPLDALCQRLRALPEAEQVDAFKRLFLAAERIPKNGVTIQKAMILAFRDFPWHQRPELFDFSYAMAERRRHKQENVWPELAFGLRSLPPGSPQFAERYQVLLAQLSSLSVSEQAKLIPILSNLLWSFCPTDARVSGLYAVLRERTLQLPPSQQGASLGALTRDSRALPEAEQPARYAEMRDLAISLPDEQWGIALRYVPLGIKGLPAARHAQELALLTHHLARVLPMQRRQAAIGLLLCTSYMDDVLSKRVWQQALNLLVGAGEAALLDVLSELREIGLICRLKNRQLQLATDEITLFMEANRFSESARARILDSFHG